MSEAVSHLISVLRACVEHLGRAVPAGFTAAVEARTSDSEATLIMRGLDAGLISVDGNYVWSRDPHQGTAWLIEGNPPHPCWEYLPHTAAYVELIQVAGVPPSLVRFETPNTELNLDLAVLTPTGRTVLLGEAKAKSAQLDSLLRFLPEHVHGDPGKAAPVARGGPTGPRRAAWKLAHQLWVLRPSILWLVAPDDRRTFEVHFHEGGMSVVPGAVDVTACELPREAESGETPRVTVVG